MFNGRWPKLWSKLALETSNVPLVSMIAAGRVNVYTKSEPYPHTVSKSQRPFSSVETTSHLPRRTPGMRKSATTPIVLSFIPFPYFLMPWILCPKITLQRLVDSFWEGVPAAKIRWTRPYVDPIDIEQMKYTCTTLILSMYGKLQGVHSNV